jgi:Fe-S-cluster containining protein
MENKEICKKCGGVCCKKAPGAYHPKDMLKFGKSIRRGIVASILSEEIAIDWYIGEPRDGIQEGCGMDRVFYLRPRHNGYAVLYDASWARGPDCIFLSKDGCNLKHDDRPKQCRDLDPEKCSKPKQIGDNSITKRDIAMWWIKYQDIIYEAAEQAGKYPPIDEDSPFGMLASCLGFLR